MGNTGIVILGSTGSIGQQTLDIVRAFPERFRVIGLAAGNNITGLTAQIEEFRPQFICCLGQLPPSSGSKYQLTSPEGMAILAEADIVVVATSGKSGLAPTLAAVRAGKQVALANKEALVAAGDIITAAARASGAAIRPVDSEHSAIWQCLQGEPREAVNRLVLTASGGPFYGYKAAQLNDITVEQALGHPTWQMGRKVTIDSATLMNKGLEVIEAHWLFGIPYERIDVLIHPGSIVHSLVEFSDGSVKAQLGYPDMRLPIQYALSHPERWANPNLPRLDWNTVRQLNFERPDLNTFPCLTLAREAGLKGGTYPAVLCAADEVAVELFLSRRIGFTGIARQVEQALAEHRSVASPTLDDILAADAWARQRVKQIASRGSRP